MSKTPDPEPSAKLPEPAGARARSETFVQRKADAKDVGIDTAFVDGLTSDLVLDGVPDHLVPEGARPSASDKVTLDAPDADEALDAEALFDAPAESDSAIVAAAPEPSVKAGTIAGAAKAEVQDAPIPPPVARTTPKAAGATASEAPLNPATLAIGGAILAIVLLLVFKTCAGSEGDEASDRTAAAARSGAAAAAADAGLENGGAAEAGDGAGEGAGAGGGAGAAEGGGGDAAEAGAAQAGGDAAEAGAAQGGDDAAEAGAEDAEQDAATGGAAAAGDTEAQDAAQEGGSGEEEVAIVDESEESAGASERSSGRNGGNGPSAMPSSGETDPDRAAEAQMSAEELLAAAKDSLKRKRYRDAYRQSTSSYHKKSTPDALKVRVESACGMNNKSAAKSSFDKVSGMSERRDLRAKCRDHGVRLGL